MSLGHCSEWRLWQTVPPMLYFVILFPVFWLLGYAEALKRKETIHMLIKPVAESKKACRISAAEWWSGWKVKTLWGSAGPRVGPVRLCSPPGWDLPTCWAGHLSIPSVRHPGLDLIQLSPSGDSYWITCLTTQCLSGSGLQVAFLLCQWRLVPCQVLCKQGRSPNRACNLVRRNVCVKPSGKEDP